MHGHLDPEGDRSDTHRLTGLRFALKTMTPQVSDMILGDGLRTAPGDETAGEEA